ncbi:MAG: ATP-binding protein [Lachnospiraceae bacterium]|nr:ATP-binding protein [Lachnospiraceae bacterium]
MKLTNTQYNSIMQEYRELQQDRDELIRQRKKELRAKVPGFAGLDDDFVDRGRQSLISVLSDGGKKPDFRALTEDVLMQEKELLRQYGYPEDYLEPPYSCPDCRDTGYVDGEPCHCFRKRAIDIVFRDEPVMKRMMTDSFDDFDVTNYPDDRVDRTGVTARQWAARALRASHGFVDTFGSSVRNIVFYGSAGSGKTFLSSCIAGSLLRTGKTVLYLSASRLFDVMADHSFRRGEASDDVGYSSIFSSDLLIIDDLGTEIPNAFTSLSLFNVISSRGTDEKPVIISTNLDLKEIRDRYTERIYSRLLEQYNFYHLFGFDGRYENGLKDLKPAKKNGGN